MTSPLVKEAQTTNPEINTNVIITMDGNACVEETEIANSPSSENELKRSLVQVDEKPKSKTIKIMKFDKATKFVFISSKTPIKLINKKVSS